MLLSLFCSNASIEEAKQQSLPQNSVQETPTQTKHKIENNDFIVYRPIMTDIAYSRRYENDEGIFGKVSGNWLTVRKETVVPENLEKVKSLPGLTDELIKDFLEKNKTKVKIPTVGDVHFAIDIIEQKGSLESFYKSKQSALKSRNTPGKIAFKLLAVIGLSRVGFNADNSQSLVYVEFYNPETQLQKRYCLITWKRDGLQMVKENIKWME